jgi:hypothetical protein
MRGTVAPCFSASRQELLCKFAHQAAVEGRAACDPEAVEDGEQQQRVFGGLTERFSLFDQQTCPLRGRLGLRRGIAFDMAEWGYERDLKLDLFAAQRRRGGQGRDLGERPGELSYGFNQR